MVQADYLLIVLNSANKLLLGDRTKLQLIVSFR